MTSSLPYPGLRPFRRDESYIFFGREEQTDHLLEKLDHSRFIAVVGPSGCGKSSLVKAGIIPALETGFMVSAGATWRVAEMRPGNHPLKNLADALLNESALGPERVHGAESSSFLLATLRRGPLGLLEVLRETPLPDHTNLMILVDQFEEIFRYRERYIADETEAFIALLLASCRDRDFPLYVVITMRSGFLGDCARLYGLPEALNDNQFLTPRLNREQSKAAIEGPAGVFGGKVESDLVNRLLNDMGPDPDQLPLMQHVLMRMWTRASLLVEPGYEGKMQLTLSEYLDNGGLESALSNHADEAYRELDDEQQLICEVMFRCLSMRGSDQRNARRPVRVKEVAEVCGVPPDRIIDIVEVFRRPDRSFIMPPTGMPLDSDKILDISHESLIRQWKRLSNWVDKEARSANLYRNLEQTALRWKSGQAALWGTPDLEIALAWKEREKPSQAWAERYGGNFDLAMEFLDNSEEKRRDQQAQEEVMRWQKLEQARQLAAERERAELKARTAHQYKKYSLALAGITVLAIIFALFTIWYR
jgi:hypothetical protein